MEKNKKRKRKEKEKEKERIKIVKSPAREFTFVADIYTPNSSSITLLLKIGMRKIVKTLEN